ncbi:GntR family transcriptional regulator [Aliidongia dinghuensis]|uniref:GntR family transcriptional regulator n=1 Tax=Aliidongia dinghuensis TaxID=1867774 RepID=A0A8J2YQ29_9PROT|nr:PLP-dependent aminotransferase family protein [Aliidongia dinghuensis]GGF03989.1 GntR family transcriptional regulator [Aliidongia dinghuensis]
MPEAFRYEELARHIEGLIEAGALGPGGRAPSLRQAGRQWRVSLTTALQAYRLLEDRGLIEARPKSGFYIARRPAALAAPAASRPPARPTPVSIPGVMLKLLEHASDPRLVPLGCAIPSAELLAASRLDRFLARAARTKGVDHNIYTEPKGHAPLRHELARRALRWGRILSAEDIAVTCGCTEALLLALKAVTRPGDTVAIESPTYFGFLQAFEALGLKAFELPTDAAEGVDLDALGAAINAGAIRACLFSSSFGNPLGGTMTEAKKQAVLDLLARHAVPLIEDDIYGDLHFGAERPRPFMALRPGADVLYCSSFSKTVAPGYRIGWIVPGRHMQRVLEHKFATTLAGPVLPQAAFAEFLASGGYDNHLRRMRRVFAETLDRMIRAIERHFPTGTRVARPEGGFVLWLELPPQVLTRALFDQALLRGICFAPGDVFSATDRYGHCLRLSGGYGWSPQIEQGLETLGEMVTALAG